MKYTAMQSQKKLQIQIKTRTATEEFRTKWKEVVKFAKLKKNADDAMIRKTSTNIEMDCKVKSMFDGSRKGAIIMSY